jgi:hypothetical protein
VRARFCQRAPRVGNRGCQAARPCRAKLFAITASGFLLRAAGAPFPYYVTFVEPNSAFSLDCAPFRPSHWSDS